MIRRQSQRASRSPPSLPARGATSRISPLGLRGNTHRRAGPGVGVSPTLGGPIIGGSPTVTAPRCRGFTHQGPKTGPKEPTGGHFGPVGAGGGHVSTPITRRTAPRVITHRSEPVDGSGFHARRRGNAHPGSWPGPENTLSPRAPLPARSRRASCIWQRRAQRGNRRSNLLPSVWGLSARSRLGPRLRMKRHKPSS